MARPLSFPPVDRLSGRGWLAVGFVYWLALVCVLEPGNLAAATAPPPLLREITRLLAAGALGAAATPAVLALASRFGLLGRSLGVLAIALVLILASCVLAAWAFEQRPSPTLAEIREELSANYALLVFGLSVFLGIVLLANGGTAGGGAPSLVFRERGRTLVIARDDVEWIDSQGNYQAVRAAGTTHLVRRTLGELEAALGPDAFVRIHRRTIVGVRFVRAVTALSNGDAVARMAGGRELRVARTRRAHLTAALAARA